MTDFEYVTWSGLEKLSSKKMRKISDNSDHLRKRKVRALMKNIDPLTGRGRRPIADMKHGMVIYGDYVEISPGDEFPESGGGKGAADKFTKNILFPQGLFEANFRPIVVVSVGARPNALTKISYVIRNVTAEKFSITVLDEANDSSFTEGMPFFVSYIAIGIKQGGRTTEFGQYESVTFPVNKELVSSDFNNIVGNIRYMDAMRVDCQMRNIDPSNKNGRLGIPYLKDNVVMYSEYKEFKPGQDIQQSGDGGGIKNKFTKEFKFPANFFAFTYLPVVVAHVGVRKGDKSAPLSIIRDVNANKFTMTIVDTANSIGDGLRKDTPMFVSYMALGMKGDI